MANYLFSLLLLAASTAATAATNITATIIHTPTPMPARAPTPTTTPITPPPPAEAAAASQPPRQELQLPNQQQLYNIIDAILGSGDFSSWANVFSAMADPSTFPLSATLFIPADEDTLPRPPMTIDPFLFPYHIVPQRLSFADLLALKTFSRLPTLLPSKSILITNNSLSNFTLDGSLLSHPDLYTTSAVAVHGITKLLDYSVYGNAVGSRTPQPPPPPLPPGALGGELIAWRKKRAESSAAASCLCNEVWTVFLVVCLVLAFKIPRLMILGHH